MAFGPSRSAHVVRLPMPSAVSGIMNGAPSMTITLSSSLCTMSWSMCTVTVRAYSSPGSRVFSLASTKNALSGSCTKARISAGISDLFVT